RCGAKACRKMLSGKNGLRASSKPSLSAATSVTGNWPKNYRQWDYRKQNETSPIRSVAADSRLHFLSNVFQQSVAQRCGWRTPKERALSSVGICHRLKNAMPIFVADLFRSQQQVRLHRLHRCSKENQNLQASAYEIHPRSP